MKRIIRVHTAYTSTHSNTRVIPAGQEVTVGNRCEEWPGWVRCTAPGGWEAWTPEVYLDIHGGTARFIRAYMAREFSVDVGDEFLVLEERSGWLFCEDSCGERGWIPSANTETIHE